MAAPGGVAQQPLGGMHVARYSGPPRIQHGQQRGGLAVARRRGTAQPLGRLRRVLRHALASQMEAR
ncbi:hypothetical protein D3C83_96470 [compost metagenome]